MQIDGETVIGVQELASGFICRRFSFIFPCDYFVLVHHCDLESRISLPRPSSRNKYCVFACKYIYIYIICIQGAIYIYIYMLRVQPPVATKKKKKEEKEEKS